jgi:hypothetical protein
LEDLGIDGMIILKLILKKYSVKAWVEFFLFRIETNGGLWRT